ncbi:MAG TPA: hypothetical protein VKU80_12595 [Planctomycetota bacterium]|nr:hypothetical protein [Planctomycetota bacterium]
MGGNKGTDRRGTSRVSKPDTARRVQPQTGRPSTGRMNVQNPGTSRSEAAQQRGAGQAAPAQDSSKSMLYIGIGGGALVFALVIFAMMGSGNESGSGGAGAGAETIVTRAMNKATEAYQRGEYRTGLDICEDALKDPRVHKSTRYTALQGLANSLRAQVNLDRDGQIKVAEFKKRIEAAVADQTAMAKAQGFWGECDQLMGQYGATSSMKQLKDIKEDLRRWVATESQGNWQKDYNVTKARIEKSFLSAQKFAEAIREWQRFGETSAQDPLLHSRVEQEIRTVNQSAQAAAEKLVADAGGGADARTKLEEGQQQFNGTDGQAVINKALKNLK